MPRKRPEAEFLAQVEQLARLLGWRTYHTHDSRKSDEGFPDLVMVNPKRRHTVYAELKADGNEPTAKQRAWLDDLAAAGEDVRVWYPDDWPEIEATLTRGYRPARIAS